MGLAVNQQDRDFFGMLERERGILEDIQLLELDPDSGTHVSRFEFVNDLGDYSVGILAQVATWLAD